MQGMEEGEGYLFRASCADAQQVLQSCVLDQSL
jgi:hypothetical protein